MTHDRERALSSRAQRGGPAAVAALWLGEDQGRPALLADGVVQSVAPHAAAGGYWVAMLPEHRPRRALVLGMGGGTVAHLLTERFGPLPIVGVDDDPRVVRLARTAFGPLPEQVQIVIADALSFVDGRAAGFDYVVVDLFHGAQTPPQMFGRPFLRAVRRTLLPGGLAVFNLFRDSRTEQRLARIAAVLRVTSMVRVRDNLLVHCRR